MNFVHVAAARSIKNVAEDSKKSRHSCCIQLKIDGQMLVVVIGARADGEVYDVALRCAEKHDNKNLY